MKTIYIIKFTNPTSPVPTYNNRYFTNRDDVEEYLKDRGYKYEQPNKYSLKTNDRYCAYVFEFYN